MLDEMALELKLALLTHFNFISLCTFFKDRVWDTCSDHGLEEVKDLNLDLV